MMPNYRFWILFTVLVTGLGYYFTPTSFKEKLKSSVTHGSPFDSEEKHITKKNSDDSIVQARDAAILKEMTSEGTFDQIDSLLAQGKRRSTSISNDSIRAIVDTLYKRRIDNVMAKYGYKIVRTKVLKVDTLKGDDGSLIIIEHADDGRCMCEYVKSVIIENVETSEPAPVVVQQKTQPKTVRKNSDSYLEN